jgi:hypothetical protein
LATCVLLAATVITGATLVRRQRRPLLRPLPLLPLGRPRYLRLHPPIPPPTYPPPPPLRYPLPVPLSIPRRLRKPSSSAKLPVTRARIGIFASRTFSRISLLLASQLMIVPSGRVTMMPVPFARLCSSMAVQRPLHWMAPKRRALASTPTIPARWISLYKLLFPVTLSTLRL